MDKLISIAIPLYNEESVFPELLLRLLNVVSGISRYRIEIIFIDDGSIDNTSQLISGAAEEHSFIRGIKLSRNFGHQTALTAAIDLAHGDAVILMDGDLQDPPELIPLLLDEYESGYEIVYTFRKSREGNPLLIFSYFIFYRILNAFSAVNIPLDSGDYALLSRRVVNHLRAMPETHRFLRGMRAWIGFRQKGVAVDRPERKAGKSKYGVAKLLSLAGDALISFSIAPLRFATFFGMIAVIVSAVFASYAVYYKVVHDISPTGFTALIVAIVFLSGAQLLSLGVIGEYVGRIYQQTKGRPHYIVDKIFGVEE